VAERIHMTRRGHQLLQQELKRLKSQDRPRIVLEIKKAREHGDLSENAEYHAAKEQQGLIEARIMLLEDKLSRAQVVDTRNLVPDRVRFGATVILEDLESGQEVTYTLVSEEEADVSKGLLSVRSPVGRALIGKAEEEEVQVRVPSGTKEYEIKGIRFDP
jgi:transcription elongation factor GreA